MKVIILLLLFIVQGCNYQTKGVNLGLTKFHLGKKILFCSPITPKKENKKFADSLGKYFYLELLRYSKGGLINSSSLENTRDVITWDNIIVNGEVNLDELSYVAETLKCDTFLVTRLLDASNFPPYRTVVLIEWYDTKSKELLAKLYNSSNLDFGDTKNKFEVYLMKKNQFTGENLFSDNASLKTALLKPEEFQKFLAQIAVQGLLPELN